MVKALYAIAGAALPVLALAVPSPQPTTHAHWRRAIDARLAREPRGFVSRSGVQHMPLVRRGSVARPARLRKRQGQVHQQGLGDDADTAYQLSLDVGGSSVYFQVDSGSSDLWAVTSQCNTDVCDAGSQAGLPRYNEQGDSSFVSTGIPITFNYGTSNFPTNATGELARTTLGVVGFQLQNATFSAITETNNNVARDSAGIFGVSFPPISNAVLYLFNQTLAQNTTLQAASGAEQAAAFVQSYTTNGPALARLALTGQLAAPGFSITLQRVSDPASSNAGLITVGGLPDGVSNSSLTYAPVFQYPGQNIIPFQEVAASIGRIPASFDVPLDQITVNGRVLPNSTLGGQVFEQVGLYGLMDSGTTAVAGPEDLVNAIYEAVDYDTSSGTVLCDTKVEMTITIGGKDFPINPLDWISAGNQQPGSGGSRRCDFLLSVNDPPSGTSVSSWIFGDVFLKNTLTYFYYGASDQTADPAKIGFLSTTDAQAAGAAFDSIYPSALMGSQSLNPATVLSNAPPSATTSLGNPVSAGTATAPNQAGGGSQTGGSATGSSSSTPSSGGGGGGQNSGATGGAAVSVVALLLAALGALMVA